MSNGRTSKALSGRPLFAKSRQELQKYHRSESWSEAELGIAPGQGVDCWSYTLLSLDSTFYFKYSRTHMSWKTSRFAIDFNCISFQWAGQSNGCLSTPRVSHVRHRRPFVFTSLIRSCENCPRDFFFFFSVRHILDWLSAAPQSPPENFCDDRMSESGVALKLGERVTTCLSFPRSWEKCQSQRRKRRASERGEAHKYVVQLVFRQKGKMWKFMHFPPLSCHNKIFEIIGAASK